MPTPHAARPAPGGLDEADARAAAGDLAGILAVTDEPLVSSDFLREPASAVIDLSLTATVGDRLHRVIAWYDNEWAHAHRLADLVALAGSSA